MKTPSGKLAALVILLLTAFILFAPMRAGTDDYITLNAKSVRMNPGDTFDIDYTLYSESRKAVSYYSSNENVATVTNIGEVTAVAPGKTRIRLISASGARAQVAIEVVGSSTASMTLNTDSLSLERGQITGLQAIFNSEADDTRVAWHSENEKVATVDATGRVSGIGGGETRIVATTANGLTAAADVKVFVRGDVVHITPSDINVGVGATLQMDCHYLPADATDDISRWQTSDKRLLAVSEDGIITARAEGQVVLSVFTENGLSGSTIINIESSADGFELTPSAVTLERGGTIALTPLFTDSNGNPTNAYDGHFIDWTSTNPEVASVDGNGLVTANKSGMTRIVARCDGINTTCLVTVQVQAQSIELNRSLIELTREETVTPIQLVPSLTPADPDDPTVTYTTDNPMVAYADEKGLVTFTGAYGTAVITATASSGATTSCFISVVTGENAQ